MSFHLETLYYLVIFHFWTLFKIAISNSCFLEKRNIYTVNILPMCHHDHYPYKTLRRPFCPAQNSKKSPESPLPITTPGSIKCVVESPATWEFGLEMRIFDRLLFGATARRTIFAALIREIRSLPTNHPLGKENTQPTQSPFRCHL